MGQIARFDLDGRAAIHVVGSKLGGKVTPAINARAGHNEPAHLCVTARRIAAPTGIVAVWPFDSVKPSGSVSVTDCPERGLWISAETQNGRPERNGPRGTSESWASGRLDIERLLSR